MSGSPDKQTGNAFSEALGPIGVREVAGAWAVAVAVAALALLLLPDGPAEEAPGHAPGVEAAAFGSADWPFDAWEATGSLPAGGGRAPYPADPLLEPDIPFGIGP